MSRAEEMFAAEAKLRAAAVGLVDAGNSTITAAMRRTGTSRTSLLNGARQRLRLAAAEYSAIAATIEAMP